MKERKVIELENEINEAIRKRKEENKLGEYIRKIRKDKKVTLVQLAEKTGLSQPYLSQIENGKRKQDSIDPEILNKIASGLGINQHDLWSKAYLIYSKVDYASNMNLDKLIQEDKELREKKDIHYLLQNEERVYYNNQLISEEDRQKVLTVLSALLSEYHKD